MLSYMKTGWFTLRNSFDQMMVVRVTKVNSDTVVLMMVMMIVIVMMVTILMMSTPTCKIRLNCPERYKVLTILLHSALPSLKEILVQHFRQHHGLLHVIQN